MASAPPNVEAVVIELLRSDAGVQSVLAQRVYGKRPPNAVDPLLVVHRVGGGDIGDWLEDARVQIDAWGTSQQTAWNAAQAACAALRRRSGVFTGGVLSGTTRTNGPFPLPDPDTNRDRYIVEFIVNAHPLSA